MKTNEIEKKLNDLTNECYDNIRSLIIENGIDNCVDLDNSVLVYYEDFYDQISKEYIFSIRLNADNNKIEYTFENDEWDYWRTDILDLGIEVLFNLQENLFNQFNK